jgi:hypothetical protein
MLFENSTEGNLSAVLFGVLIIAMVCFCTVLSVSSVIHQILGKKRPNSFLITSHMVKLLPSEVTVELMLLFSLSQLETRQELEITVQEWKHLISELKLPNDLRAMLDMVLRADERGLRRSMDLFDEMQSVQFERTTKQVAISSRDVDAYQKLLSSFKDFVHQRIGLAGLKRFNSQ